MARNAGNGRDGEPRAGSAAGQLSREVSVLQATLLGKMREEMPDADVDAFAGAAQRLAEAFGAVTAAAVDPLSAAAAAAEPSSAAAPRRRPLRSRRHTPASTAPGTCGGGSISCSRCTGATGTPSAWPSSTSPGRRPATGTEAAPRPALTVVGHALRESVRLVDEAYRLEEDALCVLAPNQDTVGGVQMSERLLQALDELEAAGGLPIEISAGVVACPEHGTEADPLLHNADEAMWRARSVGQPVGVGRLQTR